MSGAVTVPTNAPAATPAASTPFLDVDGLTVRFGRRDAAPAVRDVSFALAAGRTLCLVGESGSGKSATSLALLGLHDPRTAFVTARRLDLGGENLLGLGETERAKRRGATMSMIFQDPMSSLNPVLTIGYQVAEALRLHDRVTPRAARARALEMLRLVRIPDAERRLDSYPHELSGGMRQRVMIAMALICRPKLLIADEPTTALDVTVQAQILWLLQDLQRESGTAILFITHDLGVVAEVATDVAVMYAGAIVEHGPVAEVFDRPAHGYTVGLLRSRLDHRAQPAADGRLVEIPGLVPRPDDLADGCAFAARCAFAAPSCRVGRPARFTYADGHLAACDRVRPPPAGGRAPAAPITEEAAR
jgi:oligopeptide/dipeptide ABC transporter ATP-binding protein